jgi:hypothetical protein
MKTRVGVIIFVSLFGLVGCVAVPVPAVTVTERVTDNSQDKSGIEPEESGNSGADNSETIGQQNAIKSAQTYLSFSAFSRKGLIGQLEFEGYSNADATYAVDSLNVDWKEQAAKSAAQYLEFSSFSRQGLIDQLVFEGYTKSEAEFGVNAVGY